jgi:diguanylate cyclase (GGDEF)-like protein
MIKKINIVLALLNSLTAAYILIYYGINSVAWAYSAVLIGFFFARWVKESAIICAAIASCSVALSSQDNPFFISVSCAFFFWLAVIPYYFAKKTALQKKYYLQKIVGLRANRDEILCACLESGVEKQRYEEKIERTMQLYITGRDLSRAVTTQDYINTMSKAILSRGGVNGVNIFERRGGKWSALFLSNSSEKTSLLMLKYLEENVFLEKEDNPVQIKNFPFCKDLQEAVFWPLKSQKDNVGCIIIICESGYAKRYVDEGDIFCPQISLSVERLNLMREVNEKVRNDGLTGLYLKRYFIERLQDEIHRELRYKRGFYIIMLDIDNFKTVNDRYGHLTGDKILIAVSKILVDYAKGGNIVGRYGGEEFIIFMPAANEKEAQELANGINKLVAAKKFNAGDETFNITISAGLSNYPKDGDSIDAVINAADIALYKAKRAGRNAVVTYKKN